MFELARRTGRRRRRSVYNALHFPCHFPQFMDDHPPALTFMNALADVQATMNAIDGKEVETAKATVQQSRGPRTRGRGGTAIRGGARGRATAAAAPLLAAGGGDAAAPQVGGLGQLQLLAPRGRGLDGLQLPPGSLSASIKP